MTAIPFGEALSFIASIFTLVVAVGVGAMLSVSVLRMAWYFLIK